MRREQIILWFSLSTAIYLQLFNKSFWFYPPVYYNRNETKKYFPIGVTGWVIAYLSDLIPGIDHYFQKIVWTHLLTGVDFYKYLTLPSFDDFLFAYFSSRVNFIPFVKVTFSQNTKSNEVYPLFFLDNGKVIHEKDKDIITYKPFDDFYTTTGISLWYVGELFTLDTRVFTGEKYHIYEYNLEHNMAYRLLQMDEATYLFIDYLKEAREEWMENIERYFKDYINATAWSGNIIKSNEAIFKLMLTHNIGKFENVKLLGNALGYLPPIQNLGIIFSVSDAINIIQGKYKEVINYRSEVYEFLEQTYTKHWVFEGDILAEYFSSPHPYFYYSLFSNRKPEL